MKSFEVHRIKQNITTNCTEKLAQKTEDFLNQKTQEGFELVEVSFHLETSMGYIYSYSVFKR